MRHLLFACLLACGSSTPASTTPTEVVPTPAPVPAAPVIELPTVASSGFDRADGARPQITASPSALFVNGAHLLALTEGAVGAADLNTGGTLIPSLGAHTSELGLAGVMLQLDRRTPHATLMQLLATLQSRGLLSVAILARAGAQTVSAPLALPAAHGTAWVRHTVPPHGTPSTHVQPAIVLSGGELRLFSISGLAGTRTKPALVLPTSPALDLAQLGRTLAALRTRHPDPADKAMVVVADGTLPIQAVLEVLAVVRATPEGAALYPDIVLAPDAE